MLAENNTLVRSRDRDTINRYVIKKTSREEVVVDQETGLMWQQAASPEHMLYNLAAEWINNLNKRGFAGYNDWRLPTLEETMTLMEHAPNSAGLYIDPIFNSKQRAWMWTADRGERDSAWYVNFNYGYSRLNRIKSSSNRVRAVRRRPRGSSAF